MELLDIQKLQLFFIFTVPGMVALYVRAQFLDGRVPSLKDGLAVYVALSLIYHAVCFTFFPALYAVRIASATSWERASWLMIEFIGPALIGIASGANVRRHWLRSFLAKLGMTTVHPVASAWDWKFSEVSESWVLVTLKDGTRWSGVLGKKSFISSSSTERDLYLEKVYTRNKKGDWQERDSGVLILHDQVQTIEFWPKG